MMNIIFLDVDGVLNSIESAEQYVRQLKSVEERNILENEERNVTRMHLQLELAVSGLDWPFSEKSLECLAKIVEETNAKIVISSCWRNFDEGKQKLLAKLSEYNLKDKVIGYTPYLSRGTREEEIQAFLRKLNQPANYIILDDDIEFFRNTLLHLVKTNVRYGLQEEHVEKAIELFRKQENNEL